MMRSAHRFRFVRLAAGGLLLSVLSPLAGAEPAKDPPASPAPVAGTKCTITFGLSCPSLSGWQAFWDKHRDPCATIPPGAIPAPAGSAVRAWDGRMAQHAAADRFVIYLHEWYMGGAKLGPYGCSHLQHIAAALPSEPAFVVVEPEASPEANEARRSLVVQLLQSAGVTDADQRVVVAYPTAEGMWGEEAARAYSRGHGYGAQGQNGVNAGFGNPLQPTQGGLTPSFGGFMGGFRGGLNGGYSGF